MNKAYYFLTLALITLAVLTGTGCQQQNNKNSETLKTNTIEVNNLKIVDAAGKTRGVITVTPDGTSVLALTDNQNITKCLLAVTATGTSALEITDNEDKTRIAINYNENNRPVIALIDENRKIRSAISLAADNSIVLEFLDSNSKQRLVAGLHPDGTPVINLSDDKGKLRASLSIPSSNTPSFALLDNNNQLKAGIWINTDNQPEFYYHNKEALESAKQKTCFANIRYLDGAIEMYNMDYPEMIKTLDKRSITKLQGKYLKKEVKCPDGGIYVSDGDLSNNGFIKCTTHGAPPK